MGSGHDEDEVRLDRRVGKAGFVRHVFDELPHMVIVVEGPELRIAATTAAYRSYVGRSDMIGEPVHEVFAEVAAQQILDVIDQTYLSGQPMRMREVRVLMDHPASGHQVEIFVNVTMTPRRDRDGRVTGVAMIAQDMTEQVRERQATRQHAAAAERRYAHARNVIDTLQRELLPAGVPVLPRAQIAASYLLADTDTAAGGDWFDAVALDDGRVALMVGDVVGHGVAASAAMGQLRVVVAEHLVTTGDPQAAIRAADRATRRIRGARAATVCVAVLDPHTGGLSYATAGHPPPLLVTAHGKAHYLRSTPGGPLGVDPNRPESFAHSAHLAVNDLLLLYTDGILERPGRDLARSTVELATAAADITADRALPGHTALTVERVCAQTIELLTRVTGHSDDVTLLATQRTVAAPDLMLTVLAEVGSLAQVRTDVDDWLDSAHVGSQDIDLLRHAVVELATNVTDHAHIDSVDDHTFTIAATVSTTGDADVRVTDHGRWRDPHPSADRGLGLQITAKLMDTLHVEHSDQGTVAVVRHHLTRPAHLLTTDPLPYGKATTRPAQANPLLVLRQPSTAGVRVRVDGPVDGATASTVAREILFTGSAGTLSLTVDLTGVTHLASAGVAVLYHLAATHRGNGTDLRLFAPTGCNADMIMTLVDLPHHTQDPDAQPGQQPS